MSVEQKCTWPETSDSGPALVAHQLTTVLAWRGSGNDQLNYSLVGNDPAAATERGPIPDIGPPTDGATKLTVADNSLSSPALSLVSGFAVGAHRGESHGGIALDWLGYQSTSTGPGGATHATLDLRGTTTLPLAQVTTRVAPATQGWFSGDREAVIVAWQGEDGHGTVNLAVVEPGDGLAAGSEQPLVAPPRSLWGSPRGQAGPALGWASWSDTLYVCWPELDSGQLILLTIPDAWARLTGPTIDLTTLPGVTRIPLAAETHVTPSLAVFGPAVAVAWTDTESNIHVGTLDPFGRLNAGGPTAIDEQSVGTPSLAVRVYDEGPTAYDLLLVAWTGVDPDHSLNVGYLGQAPSRQLINPNVVRLPRPAGLDGPVPA